MQCEKKLPRTTGTRTTYTNTTLTDKASHSHTPQITQKETKKNFPWVPSAPRVLAARVSSAHTEPQPKAPNSDASTLTTTNELCARHDDDESTTSLSPNPNKLVRNAVLLFTDQQWIFPHTLLL